MLGATLLASCATGPITDRVDDRVAAKLAQYEPTGERRTCLNVRSINSIQAATETKLLVRVGANRYFLNETSDRCQGITRPQSTIVYTTSIAQLCRNEIITVLDAPGGFNIGSCGAGDFQELRLKDAPAENEAGEESDAQ